MPRMTRLSMGLLEVGLLVCAQDDYTQHGFAGGGSAGVCPG